MTGTFELDDKPAANDRPNSELDIYQALLRSQAEDTYLQEVNLGTGNYTDAEMWQQVQAFRDGLVGEAALSRRLVDRAIAQAREGVALEGWHFWDDNRDEYRSVEGWADLAEERRRELDQQRWLTQQAPRKWDALPHRAKMDAIEHHAGLTESWTPPHWRMLEMRHEASRSRGARLLDNITGRVREVFSGGEGGEGAQDALTNGNGGLR
jgi:hypothetical protein